MNGAGRVYNADNSMRYGSGSWYLYYGDCSSARSGQTFPQIDMRSNFLMLWQFIYADNNVSSKKKDNAVEIPTINLWL